MRKTVIVFVMAVFAIASYSQDKLLKPVRSSYQQDGYQIDIAQDKDTEESHYVTALNIRVAGADENLIKPATIVLVDQGKITMPRARKDYSSTEGGLAFSPSVNTNKGVSIGLNLNSLFGKKPAYSYTRAEFAAERFHVGANLKITLPNKKELVLPLESIAQ